jgi:hypothetical protein
VRRFALTFLVGLLSLSASGASSLVVIEPCTGFELSGEAEDDGACAPTCVTCGCCARAAVAIDLTLASSPDLLTADVAAGLSSLPTTDPRDILHVPKRNRA